MFKRLMIIGLMLVLFVPVLAQDDAPKVLDINFDDAVEDSITTKAIYDWWQIQTAPGDGIRVTMAAGGGLAPLIGILNSGGDLVAHSKDGDPNSTIQLEYTPPKPGLYTIVATRVGNLKGTTTGTYTLRVNRIAPPVDTGSDSQYQDVTFPCEDGEATTAATLRFSEDPKTDLRQVITVYGIDGFQPVIRVTLSSQSSFKVCNTDAVRTVGDTFTLPGEQPRTISKDNLNTVSQLGLTNAGEMGTVTVTIGSKDGKPGRYLAVIEGFSIEPSRDIDQLEVRIGPLAAKTTALTAYMVPASNSRLDPFMTWVETQQTCDDAGRKGCEDTPSLMGASVSLNETGVVRLYKGERSDAGLVLKPGNPDPINLELTSREGHTHGDYALWLIGELPPREASQ